MTPMLLLALAAAQTDVKCLARGGNIILPVVRDDDAARGIFVAVADQFMGGEDWTGMQIILKESPDHRRFIVSHYMPGMRGGGMTMTIDRCTGAITNLRYQR